MQYLHKELTLSAGDVVEVTLNNRANVQLLDEANFLAYSQNRQFSYHGGYATETPFTITAPSAGRWHLVVDLGGNAGHVRAAVSVLSSATV